MEKNNNIEKAAAMALLDRGIAFQLPAPWFMRLFGKKRKRIVVRRLRLGTLVHLSTLEALAELETIPVGSEREKVIKEMGGEPKSLPMKAIVENMRPVTQSVAACLLNSRIKIALFAKPLARYLKWAIDADQLQELIMWLFIYGRAESFTNTTKLIGRMKMTMPMNLGQD